MEQEGGVPFFCHTVSQCVRVHSKGERGKVFLMAGNEGRNQSTLKNQPLIPVDYNAIL